MVTRTAALLAVSMSESLVHLRAGGTGRAVVRLSPGGSVDILTVVPGLALGLHCSWLSGLEGNLPLGAQQRCTF